MILRFEKVACPGQRWGSDTEPELGLGQIRAIEDRQVFVDFPAADETRCYSVEDPPLHRVRFEVGDRVSLRSGETITVEQVMDHGGLLLYETGNRLVPESELGNDQMRDQPLDRLWAGHVGNPGDFTLRYHAAQWYHKILAHPACGFTGGKVQIIPHQFYIASEVAKRSAPRVLLCDEVGLGKTIEALLILHRMWVSGEAKRALILVPDALVNQWFVELYRRFNIRARIIDAEHVDEHVDERSVFDLDSLVLCGIEWLTQQPAVGLAAIHAEWDLLVVDEAHHLHWTQNEVGPKYRIVEALCEHVPGVLLLTATPEQLGRESHFARLRLLDPHRYHDLAAFLQESHGYRETAEKAQVLEEAGEQAALTDLLDRHGPGRVVFRNTRATVKGFPGRKAHLVSLTPDKEAREKWLAHFLRANPDDKVVLICASRKTVTQIDERLKRLFKVPTALFHEGMNLIQRDRSAAWFSEEDGARVLLCSEIGGEGRNFQCAHNLVLYDLPLNPEAIEQRIGRLDRIGQTETIHVWVPYEAGSAEEKIARWLHDGLNAFEQFLAGGNETYAPLLVRFEAVQAEEESLETFVAYSAEHRAKVAQALEEGRDRLMELHSFRPEAAGELIASINAADADRDYETFVLELFEGLGVYAEETAARCYLLKTRDLVSDAIKGLGEGNSHVTFDRRVALARDELTFLTADHPAVRSALDYVLAGSQGLCSVALWPDENEPGIYLECLFRVAWVAEASLQIDRFLQDTLFHTLVDMRGVDRLDLLPELDAHVLVDARKVGLLEKLQAIRSNIDAMVSAAEGKVSGNFKSSIGQATEAADAHFKKEIERLEYLKTFNDHIRDDEIETLKNRRDKTLDTLRGSQLRLDAIRLIVRTNKWS